MRKVKEKTGQEERAGQGSLGGEEDGHTTGYSWERTPVSYRIEQGSTRRRGELRRGQYKGEARAEACPASLGGGGQRGARRGWCVEPR